MGEEMDKDIEALLDVWGLTQYIAIFKENNINMKNLALLDANLTRELIRPIGDRALFIKNLDNLKKISDIPTPDDSMSEDLPVHVDILNEKHKRVPLEAIFFPGSFNGIDLEADAITPVSSPTCGTTLTDSLHLEELLNSTAEGRAILNLHKESGLLSTSSRRKLCNLIIRHLLHDDSGKRISSSILLDYAQQVNLLFSKENISTYFIPYLNNTKLKIKRCAKGKFYDCLQNRRREYREAKFIKKCKPDHDAPGTSNSSVSAEDFNEDDINFLKVSCNPWTLVEKIWCKTVNFRCKQLHENQMSVAEYMNLYPVLKKPAGYHLLIEDFKHLYPGYENNFNRNFPLYKDKLLNLLLKKHSRNHLDLVVQETIENCQEHNNKTDDVRSQEATSIYILTLLALTVVQPQSKRKNATWSPTRIESRDGFITHVTRPMDLLETINKRRDKFASLGVTLQPFIVIVGPNKTDIQAYYIVVNNTYYIIPSILEAVDACFKIFHSLHCEYPQECVALWTFIQKAFYKFKTPWDKEFISVNTFLSDLGINSSFTT